VQIGSSSRRLLSGAGGSACVEQRDYNASPLTILFLARFGGVDGMVPEINRIHITGASGCGTSTLGQAVASRLGCAFFDSDDFFWKPTVPPYRQPRGPHERVALALNELWQHARLVFSGSISGWGTQSHGECERSQIVSVGLFHAHSSTKVCIHKFKW
jgi:hypothetical protein